MKKKETEMKNRLLKTFTSLVLTVLMVLSIMPAFAITIGADGGKTYEKVELADIKPTDTIIIVSTKGTASYAMSNGNGTKAPTAVPVTVKNDTITTSATNILWNISNEDGNLTIYPDGKTDKWLYCTSTNNGVRVGTNDNKIFTMDSNTKYLKHTGTSRYLGVYNNTDWRCYTNTTGNTAKQTFSFYKLADNAEETTTETACKHTNTTPVDEVSATCTKPGKTAGEICSDCGATVSGCEETPLADHNYVNGACSVCGKEKKDIYKLVTNVNELKIGNKIIIVASDYSVALSTAQNTNNRGYVDIIKTGDTIEHVENLQVLTLKEGTKNDTFSLYTGDGYLYAASSSSNYLKTEETLSDNSSWNISITKNVATIKAQGTNTRNWLRYNSTSNLFSCYSSGQGDVLIYKFVCDHSNTEDVAEVPADCTTPGTTKGVKCSDCGEIISGCEVISATGHKDDNTDGKCDVCDVPMCGGNHTWKETERKDATCTEDGYAKYECTACNETKIDTLPAPGHTEVIDEAVAATCTATGKTEGKHCSVCGTVLVEQTETPIIGHNYVGGKCTMCYKAEPVLPFKVGDVVIFTGSQTNSGKNYEFSGFDSKQTYGCAEEYSGDPAGKFPITVVAGKISGTFAFKNGDNYIARSGSDIKLSTTLDDNSSWIVELDGDGNLVIKSYTRESNKLQFNASSPRFKVYTTNQQPIKVVKYSGPIIKSFSLSLNEGVTVKVTYNIPEAWLTANEGAKVVFSNGESFDAKAGENVYSVKLTPAQINDDLTVKIQLANGSGYGATNNVSVSAYKAKAEAAGKSAELIALLDAALTYSNAADGTIVEELTETFTGVADYEVLHAKEDYKLFAGFSGQLGKDASIYINVNTANVPDGETLVLKVGTGENEKVIINGNIADYITKDKQIVITGLYPATFNDIIYIEVSTEGSNATFTFNSYLKAIYNDNSSTQQVKNLAVATYLYGLAAEKYLAPQQ